METKVDRGDHSPSVGLPFVDAATPQPERLPRRSSRPPAKVVPPPSPELRFNYGTDNIRGSAHHEWLSIWIECRRLGFEKSSPSRPPSWS
jgi:hypothetical protein